MVGHTDEHNITSSRNRMFIYIDKAITKYTHTYCCGLLGWGGGVSWIVGGGVAFSKLLLLSCVAADGKADDDHRIKDNEKGTEHTSRTASFGVSVSPNTFKQKKNSHLANHYYPRIHERDLYSPSTRWV